MATIATNVIMNGFRGKLGNELVFRTMRGRTFISPTARKPDKRKESAAQRTTRITFKQAAEWAQSILLNPEKKVYYQHRAKALKLPNAYTAAITDYMRKPKVVKTQNKDTITYRVTKPGFSLPNVKAEPSETTGTPPKVVTRQKNDSWHVHYTPEGDTTSSLTLIITDNTLREIKFIDVLS